MKPTFEFRVLPSPCVTSFRIGGSLVGLTMPDSLSARIAIESPVGDECDRLEFGPYVKDNGHKLDLVQVSFDGSTAHLYAAYPGQTMGFAFPRLRVAPTSFRVNIRPRREYGKTILRLQNVVAVVQYDHEAKPIEPLKMDYVKAQVMESGKDLMTRVAQRNWIQHLYITCHQSMNQLRLGAGISNGRDFACLKGKVGTIWLGACSVRSNDWGKKFVKDIAESAGCHVVSSEFAVPTQQALAADEIEALTESTPSVDTPDGKILTETQFFRDRQKHKFEIARLGKTKIA